MHNGRPAKPSDCPRTIGGETGTHQDGVNEAREFADAADEVLSVLNDPREYRELLFDLADNGRVDHLENRARITRLRDALAEALV